MLDLSAQVGRFFRSGRVFGTIFKRVFYKNWPITLTCHVVIVQFQYIACLIIGDRVSTSSYPAQNAGDAPGERATATS
jgi:hypothetical protein